MENKQESPSPIRFMCYKRVEAILEQAGLSAPKTNIRPQPDGQPGYFADDVIAVTETIHSSGKNPYSIARSEILDMWESINRKRLWRRFPARSFGRTELAADISGNLGYSTEEAKGIVEQVILSLKNALIRHEKVELRDFCVLKVIERKAKVGRNPKEPSETFRIPPRWVIKLKIGKDLDAKLNMEAMSMQEAARGVFVEEPNDAPQ